MKKNNKKIANYGFLSEHFVNTRLKGWGDYRIIEKSASIIFQEIKNQYQKYSSTFQKANESELEADWIRLILEKLGYFFIPQPSDYKNRYPDHALFPTEEKKIAAKKQRHNSSAFYKDCVVVEESKTWDRDLGKFEPTLPKDERTNPGTQIMNYLRATGVRFGILTNGKYWRLYDYKDDEQRFFEIDIEAVIQSDDTDAFTAFFFVFEKEDLLTIEERCRLDQIINESNEFSIGITEKLKDRVFKHSLPFAIEGFIKNNQKLKENLENNRLLFNESLIFLYRLIFILYAEARELLPAKNEYSLSALANKLISQIRKCHIEQPEIDSYYKWLNEYLFTFIDKGSKQVSDYPLGYNGGLFDKTKHQFLEENSIPNKYLAKILHSLRITLDKKGNEVFVDYSTLGVRHLGSVYEGLLEHYPVYDNSTKAVRLETDKKERRETGSYYTPDAIVDYMVKQTVIPVLHEAVDNYRKDRSESYLYKLRYQKEFHEREKIKRGYSKSLLDKIYNIKILDPAMGSGHFLVKAVNVVASETLEYLNEDEKYYLTLLSNKNENELKHLGIDERLGPEETIELYLKRRIVENCIFGVDLNEMAVELAKLSLWLNCFAKNKPLSFLDHHLKHGNSLIGASLSEIGTPIASKKNKEDNKEAMPQISLFQETFDQKIPILATIISLLGKDPTNSRDEVIAKTNKYESKYLNSNDFQRIKGLCNLWLGQYYMDDLLVNHTIENSHDKNIAGHQQSLIPDKEKQLQLINKDSSIKNGLGNEIFYYLKDWLNYPSKELSPSFIGYFETAQKIAKEKHFFHWEIEFPEVFYGDDKKDNPGFDVIVTNPPYLGEKGHKEIFRDISKSGLFGKKFYLGKMDIFYFFFHKALDLGKNDSNIAFITTNYYPTAMGAKKLRQDFKERAIITNLINFNELKIFESALGQHNMITITQKGSDENAIAKTCITKRKGDAKPEMLQAVVDGKDTETDYFQVAQKDLYDGEECYMRPTGDKNFVGNPIQIVLEKVKKTGIPLVNMCNVNNGIFAGADTLNQSKKEKYNINNANVGDGIFILTKQEVDNLGLNASEKLIIKSLFKNSDINKYFTNNINNLFIINLRYTDRPQIDNYPNIKKHLLKFKKLLSDRPKTGTLESAFQNGYWYVMSTSRRVDMDSKKIVAPQRSPLNTFGYNEIPWYAMSDVFFITENDKSVSLKYVLALINSKLYYLWLYHRGKRKGEILELIGNPLSEIPIKKISEGEQKPFIDLVNRIIALKKSNLETYKKQAQELESQIDQLVYKLYGLTQEEIKIVEEHEISQFSKFK